MRARAVVPLVFVCLGVLISPPRGLAGELAVKSPFLPKEGASTVASQTTGPGLELHGITVTSEGTLFSIRDPAKKNARWVRLNESGGDFVVKAYRVVDGEDEVWVEYRGIVCRLALKQTKITAAKIGIIGDAEDHKIVAAQDLLGIPPVPLLPSEESRLELLATQVLSGIAREKRLGKPVAALLPDEDGPLNILISEIRVRLSREKADRNAADRGAKKSAELR